MNKARQTHDKPMQQASIHGIDQPEPNTTRTVLLPDSKVTDRPMRMERIHAAVRSTTSGHTLSIIPPIEVDDQTRLRPTRLP